ncbi:Leucine-rich repeat and calponin homology domain-containing protein 1, partial [Eschrichtius robustus]|nr:Leucine-rich repeat and calponin homology domain-containing protein 1 [Eschrichtius robustus]
VQNDLTLQSNGSEYSPNEMRENSPAISPTNASTALFGLKPRSVFLRPQRNLESIDPQFTIRRKMEQLREEKELVEQLRE